MKPSHFGEGHDCLQAFCHIVARDGLGAAAVLRTQLRHAINLADYIAARTPLTQPRLADARRVFTVLDQQIEYGLNKSLESARAAVRPEAWAADPIEAFSSFIQARSEAASIERQILDNFARMARSLRQAAYAHLTEFPSPSLFFGLEQAKIAERVDMLAHTYHRELLKLAGSLGAMPRLATESTLAVSYEYVGSGNYGYTERFLRKENAVELHTQISVPRWLLYTPRYFPVICHELAHPIAGELLADGGPFGSELTEFRPRATQVIEQHLGRALLRSNPDVVPTIARELLTDILSVRVAGSSYAVAWHASTLGRGALSPRQSLSLPACVRLRLLLLVTDSTLPKPLTKVLEDDTELYRKLLAHRRYLEKSSFQEELYEACVTFVRALREKVAVQDDRRSPPDRWNMDVEDAFVSTQKIPRFGSTSVPSPEDLAILWSGDALRSVPGLLWQTHLSAPAATGDDSKPEGRIFHVLHRQRMTRWTEGDYSEWLWVKRMMTGPRREFRDWWDEQTGDFRPLTADVIGAYNFLSVRPQFEVRSFGGYPPAAGKQHFHAARQILVELRRRDTPFEDGLTNTFRHSPLLVVETLIPPAGDHEAFLDLANADRPGLRTIASFKTLGTGDYVLVVHVTDLSAVPGMLDDFRRNNLEVRTQTNLILPVGATVSPDPAIPSGPTMNVRAFLSFQRAPPRAWMAELGVAAERVLGVDDGELCIPVASVADLEKVLTIADLAATSCALATFHARAGFVMPP